MAQNNLRSAIVGLACFSAVSVATLAYVLYEPSGSEGGSPRAERMNEFQSQIGLAEGEKLVWSPVLLSETYDVGSVFPAEGLAQAITTSCDGGEAVSSQMSVRLGQGKRYRIEPSFEIEKGVDLELSGAKSLEYALSVDQSKVIPAYADLIRSLASDPECLALIANRPVMVLYGVYRGDEHYDISRTLAANFVSGNWAELAGAKLGLSGDAAGTAEFSREDAALIWSLTRVLITDPRFPTGAGEGAQNFRLRKANELLRQETDYAARAVNRAEVTAPSPSEVDAALIALQNMAPQTPAAGN